MQCLQCGAEQDQSNAFCTKCGSRLAPLVSTGQDFGTDQEIPASSAQAEEEKILQELKEALKVVDQPKRVDEAPQPPAFSRNRNVWILAGLVVAGAFLLVTLLLLHTRRREEPPPSPPPETAKEAPPTLPFPVDEEQRTTVGKMAAVLQAITQYSKGKKALPPTLASLNTAYTDSGLLRDGWGQNIYYLVDLTNKTFVLRSCGPDGRRETADDLTVTNENADAWLSEHEGTIAEWKTASPSLYAQLTSVGPSPDEMKKLQSARKEEEQRKKQEAEARRQAAAKQEEEQRRLEVARREDEARKQAEARKHEEEARLVRAREEAERQRQALLQSMIVKDDFSEGLAQWDAPSSWELVRDDSFPALRVQGLGMLKKGDGWQDYRVEFSIKISKESGGWLVRAQDKGNFYLFKLGSEKAKAIPKNSLVKYVYADGKYLNSLKRGDAPGAAGVTPLPIKVKNKDYYKVLVVAKGNTISHYVDGVQVDSFTDDTFRRGRFGFNASIIEMALVRAVTVEPVR